MARSPTQLDLFGDKPRRPRRKPRVLMHVIDAGDNDGEPDYAVIARFQCSRCSAKTDWLQVENVTAAKRGIPCVACNPESIESGAGLLQDKASLADIDQLVAPPAVRADEIYTERIDTRLDIGERNFNVTANAFPHDRVSEERDL
jgi:hypothetical protein